MIFEQQHKYSTACGVASRSYVLTHSSCEQAHFTAHVSKPILQLV
ncbi:hypothetical protein V6Z12_D06G128300 [Gossypium hirsutum]